MCIPAIFKSCEAYDDARKMDLADRYLNTKVVRAQLLIDDVKNAQPTMLLFSKDSHSPHSPPQDPKHAAASTNLHDMQCMWYERCVADSLHRQGINGRSLRYYRETLHHFLEFRNDEFDFHVYCLRRNVLPTYISMLSMRERLYSHKDYRGAAKGAL